MRAKISQLLQEGLEEKRMGNFEEAMQYYFEALDLDPSYQPTYQQMGKTAYLADQTVLSVFAYLSSMHLDIRHLEQKIVDGVMPMPFEKIYNDLPPAMKDDLPRKSGVLIYMSYDPVRHLAHTLMDSHSQRPKELDGLVEIYRAQIQGSGAEHNYLYEKHGLTPESIQKTEREVYMPYGLKPMLELIQWDKILSDDVVNIYFDENNPIIGK